MSDNNKSDLAIKCWAAVASGFAFFHNKDMRGPSFTWDRFDGMHEAKLIIAPLDLDEEHRWFVADLCGGIARQLKREAGYLEG